MRKKGSINHQYKIRKVAQNQQGNKIYGITIPNFIAEKFVATKFVLTLKNNSIIFSSGCDIKEQSSNDNYFDKFTSNEEQAI